MPDFKSDWLKKGKERLKEFRDYVEEKGYFLGVCKDDDGNDHLVVTKNFPDGGVLDCFFAFTWVNVGLEKVFLSPEGVTEKRVYPLNETHELNISPNGVIPRFENVIKELENYPEHWIKHKV